MFLGIRHQFKVKIQKWKNTSLMQKKRLVASAIWLYAAIAFSLTCKLLWMKVSAIWLNVNCRVTYRRMCLKSLANCYSLGHKHFGVCVWCVCVCACVRVCVCVCVYVHFQICPDTGCYFALCWWKTYYFLLPGQVRRGGVESGRLQNAGLKLSPDSDFASRKLAGPLRCVEMCPKEVWSCHYVLRGRAGGAGGEEMSRCTS